MIVNKIEQLIIACTLIVLTSCSTANQKKEIVDYQSQFLNVLKVVYTPTATYDINTTLFSDNGAWQAYTAPLSPQSFGGFSGPLVMDLRGEWLSKNFAQLHIVENGKAINWENAQQNINYFPGKLQVKYLLKELEITQTLVFVNERTATFNTEIQNKGSHARHLQIEVTGQLLPDGNLVISQDNNSLVVELDTLGRRFTQSMQPHAQKISLTNNMQSYTAFMGEYNLKSDEKISYQVNQSHIFSLDEKELKVVNFDETIRDNTTRWNSYLKTYFQDQEGYLTQDNYQQLATKAIMTLVTNYRSAAKDLLHPGTFPSVSYQGFYGFWSWDSWKHAVAYADFAPEMAKNNIYSMFDYQDQYGMVADCIYTEKNENNWRDTKPPLAAWAVWTIYEKTNDKNFLIEMMPKLKAYHKWWYAHRDIDANGMCEYGCTDGTRIAAAWESGMDNAVRFDNAVMLKKSSVAWSLNQESVDLNAYLYAEKCYLNKMLIVLGDKANADIYLDEAVLLKERIKHLMFQNDYFHDISIGEKQIVDAMGPEGWIPLWANIATPGQAQSVYDKIMDSKIFNTFVPFPTLAANHPKFNPLKGYWRGPVWVDQVWFGVQGLRNYGFTDEADALTLKFIKNAKGLLSDAPIHENYHPLTGEGLNAENFSWSSAHILMLLKDLTTVETHN